MKRIVVDITPSVLQWAREEAGYNTAEIASKVKIDSTLYEMWERNGENIPLGKLKHIANHYKRQLAVFFLPEAPHKIVKPKDFRNVNLTKNRLSKEVLSVMRDISLFRQTALDIKGETYWRDRSSWLEELTASKIKPHQTASWLREKLHISIEEQQRWKTSGEAYHTWRRAVENQLGVLIFQFPMPLNEVHGFCLTDDYPHALIVNSNHSYTSRIFTVFHELAHIMKRTSGICLWGDVSEKQYVEIGCNSFAGEFLIPKTNLHITDKLEDIHIYANRFKISPEVYLRRLKEEKEISLKSFFLLLEQMKAAYVNQPKKKNIIIRPEVKSRASRGDTFYTLVLDALNQNRLSYTQASGILDLNLSRVIHEA